MSKPVFVKSFVLGLGMISVLSAGLSHATTIGACDSDLPGLCTKSVTLSGNTLTITLTNTSPSANGGYITADAFDLAGAATITAYSTTDADFTLFPAPPSGGGVVNVSPFGDREFVIGLDNTFEGGGSPVAGISTGTSATFTLTLGGNISSVTELSVFNSEVVRFRGFTDGSSDKDLITRTVPEPASLLLLGSGLAAIGFWNVKRRKSV